MQAGEVVPFDWQAHDMFFVVAHCHWVIFGGVVFPLFAGLHYWLPKVTGRMPPRRAGCGGSGSRSRAST